MPAYIAPLNPRYIGMIIPDIVTEEIGADALMITENPVEMGVPVADHAYHRPTEITLRSSWSNSTHMDNGFSAQIYEQLLALQIAAEPFTVTTPKRQYQSMLISSLVVTTDADSEYVLNCIIGCKQVIITSASGFAGPAAPKDATEPTSPTSDTNPTKDTSADPSQTSPVNPGGSAPTNLFQPSGVNAGDSFDQNGGFSTLTSPSLGSTPGQGYAGAPAGSLP
jgi:hypothetical protein